MTEYTTTSRGDTVGYDRYGSGPALVFVAGAGPYRATDAVTTATARRVADLGLTALVFDRLGRGDSPAQGRLDLDRELEAIRAVLEIAGSRGVLCGHSSGCSIALKAAAAGLPVDGVAMYEAPVAAAWAPTQAWSDEIERLIDADDREGAMRHYMKDMPEEWLARAEAQPSWAAIAAGVVSNRADAQSLAWATRALEEDELRDLDVPVLVTYGTETFPEMVEGAEMLVTALPRADREPVPGAQHRWETEPMAQRLATFVRQASAG